MKDALVIFGFLYIAIGAALYFFVLGSDLKKRKISLTGFLGTVAGISTIFEILFLVFWPLWLWLYWRSEKKEPNRVPVTD